MQMGHGGSSNSNPKEFDPRMKNRVNSTSNDETVDLSMPPFFYLFIYLSIDAHVCDPHDAR